MKAFPACIFGIKNLEVAGFQGFQRVDAVIRLVILDAGRNVIQFPKPKKNAIGNYQKYQKIKKYFLVFHIGKNIFKP